MKTKLRTNMKQIVCFRCFILDPSMQNMPTQFVAEAGHESNDEYFNEIIEEASEGSISEEENARVSMFRDMSMTECMQYLAITKNGLHSTVNVLLEILREKNYSKKNY